MKVFMHQAKRKIKIGKIYHAKNVIGITSGRTNSPEL